MTLLEHKYPSYEKNVIYITTKDDLNNCVDDCISSDSIGIDIEADSYHHYNEKICLIQISTLANDYIIDTIEVQDLSSIKKVLENNNVEKIFHSAASDLSMLMRHIEFKPQNIFDTFIAAKLLSYEKLGLIDLVKKHFDVSWEKKYQLYDWSKRPLADEHIFYARSDSHYLILLKEILLSELVIAGKKRIADVAFKELNDKVYVLEGFSPEGFWQLPNISNCTSIQRGVVRSLYILREELAQKNDFPPLRLISNKTILAMAINSPKTKNDLYKIPNLSPKIVQNYYLEILNAIKDGKRSPIPKPIVEKRLHSEEQKIRQKHTVLLKEWRKIEAAKHNVEPHLLLSNNTLKKLIAEMPDSIEKLSNIGNIAEWQIIDFGETLINIFKT